MSTPGLSFARIAVMHFSFARIFTKVCKYLVHADFHKYSRGIPLFVRKALMILFVRSCFEGIFLWSRKSTYQEPAVLSVAY